jgi:guanosine-3',5'-bis(diphosphate) 3'-pyrophosphohydrolase
MSVRKVLDQVEAYATRAHGEQRRKYTPEPYIVHPVRVMKLCAEYTKKETILCAALLHDVLEDTPVTEPQLLDFLAAIMDPGAARETLKLVVDLTDVFIKENYPQYNRRLRKDLERERIAKTHPDSQTVKYADIIDNCNEIVKYDRDFARVFLHECRATLKVIRQGHAGLLQRAENTVQENIGKLHKN